MKGKNSRIRKSFAWFQATSVCSHNAPAAKFTHQDSTKKWRANESDKTIWGMKWPQHCTWQLNNAVKIQSHHSWYHVFTKGIHRPSVLSIKSIESMLADFLIVERPRAHPTQAPADATKNAALQRTPQKTMFGVTQRWQTRSHWCVRRQMTRATCK